jgi:hypothetical protein
MAEAFRPQPVGQRDGRRHRTPFGEQSHAPQQHHTVRIIGINVMHSEIVEAQAMALTMLEFIGERLGHAFDDHRHAPPPTGREGDCRHAVRIMKHAHPQAMF